MIEHKYFESGKQDMIIVIKEYPENWTKSKEAYYPINNERNQTLFKKYKEESKLVKDVIFGGRLAEYGYHDMHQIIGSSLIKVREISIIEL